MELRSLRYFQAVYELGSVSGAARQCFVSQPSITAAIKQLEHTLDTCLFVRHTHGVLPTPAADKLYPLAREMSASEKTILQLFGDGPTPVSLRLGLMRSLGAQRMSYLLTELTQRIDNLELTLVDPDEPCDARIILRQSVTKKEDFVPIWQDNYLLALPKAWPMTSKATITIDDLDSLPFINRSPCDVLERVKLAMATAGVHFQPRANIRTIEYAWPLVSAGVGAALLPDWREIREAEGIVLRQIDSLDLSKSIGLAVKANRGGEPLISSVIEVCDSASSTVEPS
ncbi:LysR family transcriptional regulator [Photobacterium sp. SDRW27]|uniref:LysR family transcriptional regulator n=1 Tax=Photobacterium obscurum TaxID=2829490 RepID=UPI002243CE7B|nr:LysR family transcriptional regulator [Photobacterium obscurum]MCW8329074.1 LysR family transcriptional regulator [Photobacterium obscurum]